MIVVLALIAAATTAGVLLERQDRAVAHRTADGIVRLIVWALMPFVILFVAPRLDFGGGVGAGLLLAFAELAVVGLLAFVLAARVLRLSRPVVGSVVCAVILANTGYLGVPLVGALLGHDDIPDAVAWDALVSNTMLYLPGFAVGAAFGTQAGEGARERTAAFLTRNPVLYALVAGLLMPPSWSPDVLFDAAQFIAGYGVLPLGFFLLGVNLMEERDELGQRSLLPRFTPAVGVVCLLRLAVAPALLVGLVLLSGASIPDAFFVQAAMPSGINTLVVAHTFGLDLRTAAGAIAWSTMLAIGGAAIASGVV